MYGYFKGCDQIVLETEGNVRFGCPLCGWVYNYRRDLARHLRYERGMEPKFSCPHCSYKAKLKATLKTHVALKHIVLQSLFIPSIILLNTGIYSSFYHIPITVSSTIWPFYPLIWWVVKWLGNSFNNQNLL